MSFASARLVALAGALAFGAALVSVPAHAQTRDRSGGSAFAIEALGGTAGSLAGVGVGLLLSGAWTDRCNNEDLACLLRQIAATGVVSVAGATAGTYIAGRAADTGPSFVGGLLGAVAGAAAGAGVIHLLTEETRVADNNATLAVAYSVTQGIVSALGSRLLSRLR